VFLRTQEEMEATQYWRKDTRRLNNISQSSFEKIPQRIQEKEMAVEFFIPKMSDHMEQGEIVDWLVHEGDHVEAGQGILEIMTDKVTAEVEAPASGVLRGIRKGVEKGSTVQVGKTIAFIAESDEEELPELPPLLPSEAEVIQKTQEKPGVKESVSINATSVAMKFAEQFQIDLRKVKGSGPGGRIQKEDVQAYMEESGPSRMIQKEEVSEFRSGKPPEETLPERVKASPAARRRAREAGIDIRVVKGTGPDNIITERDVNSFLTVPSTAGVERGEEWLDLTPVQTTAPQFSLDVTADAEKLLWIRDGMMEQVESKTGRRLSITTLLVKIVAAALHMYPRACSSFENGRLKIYTDVNINVAVGGPAGLVAPVIKNADRKTLSQINGELKQFEEKMKDMRFTSEELVGGHFTISNLGMYGIDRFRAIVNPPQSGILACGRIIHTPVGTSEKTIALRPVIKLTLTVDHRCLDGIQGAQFLNGIKQMIENPIACIEGSHK
jgi:pyruvate dehydrogenase E2 component (dihydrolipoamide acetyltransferase)